MYVLTRNLKLTKRIKHVMFLKPSQSNNISFREIFVCVETLNKGELKESVMYGFHICRKHSPIQMAPPITITPTALAYFNFWGSIQLTSLIAS